MRYLLYIGFIICTNAAISQTQLHMTNYVLHQPFINSAAIGSYNSINGAVFMKMQWVGIKDAPVFQGLNFNLPFSNEKSYLGITVFNDRIGVNKTTDIALSYAHRIKLNEVHSLSFGLGADIAIMQSNYSELTTIMENDPLFSADTRTYTAPNFNTGLYFFSKKYYVGFSIPKLLTNQIVYNTAYKMETTFNVANFHYHLQGGYKFRLAENYNLYTSTLVKYVAGSPIQVDLNTMLEYNEQIGLGLTYRTSTIVNGLLNFKITKSLKIGYSYGYNFNELRNFSNGSHEIILIFNQAKNKLNAPEETPRF